MAFEVYTGGRLQYDGPAITITSLGRMVLNKRATAKFAGLMAEHLELLADRTAGLIALRPTMVPGSGAIKMRFRKNQSGMTFSCVAFLNHIGYDWSVTRTFHATWTITGTTSMLVIDVPLHLINQTHRISRSGQIRKIKGDKEGSSQEKEATEVAP